ncbi:hypothetical protein BH11PSE8_BH11PSE8_36570 [soil metagenome]
MNPPSSPKPACRRSSLRGITTLGLACLLGALGATVHAEPEAAWEPLRDGSVILFRHAMAPGGGDPPGATLNDCRTQRNLDEAGRAQARNIGAAFRARGVDVGSVLTSQWCRTRETAALAFPGRGRDDVRFNSFFGDASKEVPQTEAALAMLSQWRGPGVLVVVTHQVNITALTGIVPSSGEGVIVRPKGQGIDVLGRLQP